MRAKRVSGCFAAQPPPGGWIRCNGAASPLHSSAQADSLDDVEAALLALRVPFVRQRVVEGGVEVRAPGEGAPPPPPALGTAGAAAAEGLAQPVFSFLTLSFLTVPVCASQVKQLFLHDPDRNMIEVCTCDALPLLPVETDVQLLRCHTCAAEAQRLRTSHASSGQGSAEGSSAGELEAACEHAAAAEECWLPVAEQCSPPRPQRRSSAENEEGNAMPLPPPTGGCCAGGAAVCGRGVASKEEGDAEAEELAEMMMAVL